MFFFLQDTPQGLFQECFLNFLIKHRIYRACIPLENGLDVIFFTFCTPHVPQVSCTLNQLYLGVYNSQMGGVSCISCFGSRCSFLSGGGVPELRWDPASEMK